MSQPIRNSSYVESILSSIDHFGRLGECNEFGVDKESIFKYCEVSRSYTNKLQMLNQIRLALRKAVDDGTLVSTDMQRFKRTEQIRV